MIKNPFCILSKGEKILWGCSVVTVIASFLLSASGDFLTLTASLIGVTALIFIARGHVFGQILCVVFAIFYGLVSFYFRYYGETITYLGMSAPISILSTISWLLHPYEKTDEVEVSHVTKKQVFVICVLALLVTAAFYFILKALGNTNLIVSVISVTTSFIASYPIPITIGIHNNFIKALNIPGISCGINKPINILIINISAINDVPHLG